MTTWTIIKASAGSGKTYRLTELLTERLRRVDADGTHPYRPSQIIATTFTRAAAAELKERIRGTLVDDGLLEQAAALPTALIGTVNSVTGRILTDFAMDAGRSPELSVLTEQSQKDAFRLATDRIIADAETSHRDLLARTGYDDDSDGGYFSSGVNWAATVRTVTDHARANDIDAADLAGFAESSIRELHLALDSAGGPATGDGPAVDTRSLLAGAAQRIPDQLRADIEAGRITTRSAASLQSRFPDLDRFARRVRRERHNIPWRDWLRTADGKVPGVDGPTKPIKEAYGGVVTSDDIAADPDLRADLDALIRLVFDTAAACLDAYAEYKNALGLIDFTDQEQLTLRLLRGDGVDPSTTAAVRTALAARYRILVVDEFQDTSPLQLALFTELAGLVEEVIWVGDPKQSIYGFRGSDPALMDAAVETITDPDGVAGTAETLSHSWRTHAEPLGLSNRLFGHLFPGQNVTLTVPGHLAEERSGGATVLWTPAEGAKKNKDTWFARIATGLRSLEAAEGVPARGRAVLVRNNTHAAELRAELRRHGIPCTGGGTPLAQTREGQLVRAAVAWLLDERDTQALVELVTFLDDHAAHTGWFDTLTALGTREERRERFADWAQDESLAPLRRLRPTLSEVPVADTVGAVIDALDLRRRIATWTDPTERTGSVLGILRAVEDYTAEADSGNRPATPAGFLEHLASEDAVSAPTADPGAVFVDTIHQSKGLEWDTVVVALPDVRDRFVPAGVWVQSTAPLTMEAPLAGREIRFWPATVTDISSVKELLADTGVQTRRRQADMLEEQRVLYVALTRSRTRTVLAPYSGVGKWKPLAETGLQDDQLTELLGCPVREIDASDTGDVGDADSGIGAGTSTPLPRAAVLDSRRALAPVPAPYLPATFAPSGVEADDDILATASVAEIADLGEPLVSGGGEEWNKVGDCIHAYLAAPLGQLSDARRQAAASRLVAGWGVGDRVTADQVVTAGQRWTDWVGRTFPGAVTASEVPFAWTNPDHQRAQGWLDQLLTLPDGRRVVVDHKTYPGLDPVGHVRATYLGQMDVYRRALTDIDGRPPAAVLVHLPLLGSVLEVSLT
ncbi:UvrD-helicase domain-containing protein [Corynebacterium kalidii]|uniref:DNA 3'-5' helicase n=1 Tax=Corynebacterium kalidii TaxID=2931982 RepID=A0A9X1WIU4_9CORY|nr:UvrD-helicase domain-containing protein [Corynebacterium kalidii]MCJ7858367.1 UvrD-helicase domain-containing protein [Corynebacterium kalidii]